MCFVTFFLVNFLVKFCHGYYVEDFQFICVRFHLYKFDFYLNSFVFEIDLAYYNKCLRVTFESDAALFEWSLIEHFGWHVCLIICDLYSLDAK